jgi:hypothetical protein
MLFLLKLFDAYLRRLGWFYAPGYSNYSVLSSGEGSPASYFAPLRNGLHSTLCEKLFQVVSQLFCEAGLTLPKLSTTFSRGLSLLHKMLCHGDVK